MSLKDYPDFSTNPLTLNRHSITRISEKEEEEEVEKKLCNPVSLFSYLCLAQSTSQPGSSSSSNDGLDCWITSVWECWSAEPAGCYRSTGYQCTGTGQ